MPQVARLLEKKPGEKHARQGEKVQEQERLYTICILKETPVRQIKPGCNIEGKQDPCTL